MDTEARTAPPDATVERLINSAFAGVIPAADLGELDEVLDRTSRPTGGER